MTMDCNHSVHISKEIYNAILSSCPLPPPESGGILGIKNDIISSFFFDSSMQSISKGSYIPNITVLNQHIEQWSTEGISFCGIFHTHPANQEELSPMDIVYITSICKAFSIYNAHLFFPIVLPKRKMIFYQATFSEKHISLQRVNIQIT